MNREEMVTILKSQFQGLLRNEISLSLTCPSPDESCNEEISSKTKSFFGGKPLLPSNFQWPRYADNRSKPLSFLGQFDLEKVSSFDKEELLPKTGILSFFYDLDAMEWGDSPSVRDSFQVYYFAAGTNLEQTDFPHDLDEEYQLPLILLDFSSRKSLPKWEEYVDLVESPLDADILVDGENPIYYKVREEILGFNPKEGSGCKILGYGDILQDSAQLQCELVACGYEIGNGPVPLNEQEKTRIKETSKDWILLFQINSLSQDSFADKQCLSHNPQYKNLEVSFGDYGQLYFYIRRQDLIQGHFDSCQMILQCL